MSNEPIDEQDFLSGVNVVDIGDIRVSRGKTRRPTQTCTHAKMSYDPIERRVWCKDCEHDVDGFDAFVALVSQYDSAIRRLEILKEDALAAQNHNMRRIAAKNLEKEWNSRITVPCCPHCNISLFADDFKDINRSSRSLEAARRKRDDM